MLESEHGNARTNQKCGNSIALVPSGHPGTYILDAKRLLKRSSCWNQNKMILFNVRHQAVIPLATKRLSLFCSRLHVHTNLLQFTVLASCFYDWTSYYVDCVNMSCCRTWLQFVYSEFSMKLIVGSLAFFLDDFFEHVLIVVSLGKSTQHLVIKHL